MRLREQISISLANLFGFLLTLHTIPKYLEQMGFCALQFQASCFF